MAARCEKLPDITLERTAANKSLQDGEDRLKGGQTAEEVFSKSGSESGNDDDHAVALLMVAEVQEKLCAAMHHYNQHRRFDTKVVAKFAYQLYRLISCISWLILPTIASVLAGFIADTILDDNNSLKMYKNYAVIVANSILWLIGLYNLSSIWTDMRDCSDALACLNNKRWMQEEEYINRMLCRGYMGEPDVNVKQGDACVGTGELNQDMGGELRQDMGGELKAAVEEIESGAAGDIPKTIPKDKDV